jgi:hypothetical protein
MSRPALPQVSGSGSTRVAGRARGRAIAGAVLPRRILAAGQNRPNKAAIYDVQGLGREAAQPQSACPYDRSGRRHLARWCALGRLPTRLSQSAALGARGDFAASSQQAAIKLQVQVEDAAGNRAGVLIAGNAAILPSPPRDGSKPRPSFTTIRTLRRSSGMSSGRTLSRQIVG